MVRKTDTTYGRKDSLMLVKLGELAKKSSLSESTISKLVKDNILIPVQEEELTPCIKRKLFDLDSCMAILERRKLESKLKRVINMDSKIKNNTIGSEDRETVDFWNKLCKELSYTRGKKCNFKDYPSIKDRTNLILRFKNTKYIVTQMESYFDCCKARLHINNNGDYSYTTLLAFLKRIYNDLCKDEPHWWNKVQNKVLVDDTHPKLTQKLANKYAQIFLAKWVYRMDNPSEDYKIFKEAGDKFKIAFKELHNKNALLKQMPDNVEILINLVFETLWTFYGEQDAKHTQLANSFFWKKYKDYASEEIGI